MLSAGPMYRMHFVQNEKVWPFALMIYAQRCRTAGYVPQVTVLRNKQPASILLSVLRGTEHLAGAISLQTMFDGGTEPKDVQQWYWDNIGPDSVYIETSQQTNCIESLWKLLHDKCF